ncbi:hypothetical protein BSAF29S_05199 [Bacillus safensis subsp. safensis]
MKNAGYGIEVDSLRFVQGADRGRSEYICGLISEKVNQRRQYVGENVFLH